MNTQAREIKVSLDFGAGTEPVGRLAINNQTIYFEYELSFLGKGLEISPFHLPLKKGVIELPYRPFEGLAGVFNDSLPDGWGRLLFDRMVRSKGFIPQDFSPLDRLANVGLYGLGALVYEPNHIQENSNSKIDLDLLADQTEEVLQGSTDDIISELLSLNGSSAGARPKALIGVDSTFKNIIHGTHSLKVGFDPWIVKFPNQQDGTDAGAIEFVFSKMAALAGINVPDIHLFSSSKSPGYFAVKRFDRENGQRIHMHTVSGLLHSDFRVPALDYEDLLNLTGRLTKDIREVEKIYRLAVFNVLSHNRDDHGKNFSFLMDSSGNWRLAPAYDLTFSSGPRGEQSTMVMGEGRNPRISHLLKLGIEAKISKEKIDNIIEQTVDAVNNWENLAKNYGVSQSNISFISKAIKKITQNDR
ncbi:type II toxin-antitoxin system HipA family toxin [Belliella kenyensis]|uniref:Type II toxin-antitoxin system HipA family toxin n=1 Tax=Belliella kenyensis TaxID=1472724 RepID=A0ABV8EQ64_9BACT|nr:type II toxin-antitoxin system HipA family toxin [Belliella kenyensis]MCH7402025.1 type II toxin-antitoxin system HipA family toxin [Belliella kenyensis]MDN3605189.1 type II toxin-antitoxin system HipA family toxin [Belliella kenyensis]